MFKKLLSSLLMILSVFALNSVSYAGLFGGDDEYALKAIPFDFNTAMNNPKSIAPDYLDTYSTLSIKGIKKVIIPHFQVRFCMQDDASKAVQISTSFMTSTYSAFAGVNVAMSPEYREMVTKKLYDRFKQRLKERGIEVIEIDPSLDIPELKKGLAESHPSGTIEELFNAVNRMDKKEKESKNKMSYPWAIHFPSSTSGLIYGGIMEGAKIGESWARVAENSTMPPSVIKLANKLGAGVIYAGFEVRVEKMHAYSPKKFTLKPELTVEAAPVLRTRLLSMKIMPENGKQLVMAIGMSGGVNFVGMNFAGLQIQPIASANPFSSPKNGNYPWVEMDGSYGGLRGTETKGSWILQPDEGLFIKDFDKVMDAQLNMAFGLIDNNL